MGEELQRVDVGEGAGRPALADGNAYGFDDHCVTHGVPLASEGPLRGTRAGPAQWVHDNDPMVGFPNPLSDFTVA